MLKIIEDEVRFPKALEKGRTISRTYRTYPYRVYQANCALRGIDYGFSDQEGMFFRTTIDTSSQIISPYEVKVTITFGFRSREFDKKTDATIKYTLFLQYV
ncbi:hypothetical protein MXL46_17495 [Heyndrickxia sporothermodurans]|uniref:Uncharacterized protein n=1 Tax=Heyndrickxia sporothermodurans TaxID=46224 RepID=A0A150KKL0_9BACI|nr:hypothetical protein [Heyndrickxia sporothermodurans]KYC90344.1 hypothetical protein B4102_3852 [Heyndrickxia sporothermodurans]MBL5771044.1 hypothetical protein [Heyndrickxia sporothermodurans]MBL5774713.1 hypothetical protein [Heyndrickxia sporothermodurans]MBL5778171.1 hypothetical protein [Heyndrickxia sporothermodurans]MBL5785418.1 hypothetical protein [Heyndrickxia sporothermodurans]